MCLFLDPVKTKRASRTGTTYVYKLLSKRVWNSQYTTPYQDTKVPNSGKLKSRRNGKLYKSEIKKEVVHKGIHVFRTKEAALRRQRSPYCSVRVFRAKVNRADLVAIGKYDDAVYTQIHIDLSKEIK